jgi:hypothetical protein
MLAKSKIKLFAFGFAMIVVAAGATSANAVAIVSSFNTGGQPIGVAQDPLSGNLFIYNSFTATIDEVTTASVPVGSIARPGASSNDFGLDFGPSGLIAFNGDDSPETASFFTGTSGPITTLTLPSASLVGGTFNQATGTLFTVDFTNADLVREIDPLTGVELNSFSPQIGGFDVFFGGIDALTSGNLVVVSDSQNIIREMTATGAIVNDTDISSLFAPSLLTGGMSGVSAISATELWITTTGGDVALLNLTAVPEPSTLAILTVGLIGLGMARRRRPVSTTLCRH